MQMGTINFSVVRLEGPISNIMLGVAHGTF